MEVQYAPALRLRQDREIRAITPISILVACQHLADDLAPARLRVRVDGVQGRAQVVIFATHLLEDGVDLRYIQKLLGHEDPCKTMIYTPVSNQALGHIRSPLDNLTLKIEPLF